MFPFSEHERGAILDSSGVVWFWVGTVPMSDACAHYLLTVRAWKSGWAYVSSGPCWGKTSGVAVFAKGTPALWSMAQRSRCIPSIQCCAPDGITKLLGRTGRRINISAKPLKQDVWGVGCKCSLSTQTKILMGSGDKWNRYLMEWFPQVFNCFNSIAQ